MLICLGCKTLKIISPLMDFNISWEPEMNFKKYDNEIDEMIKSMTLGEKLGQLNMTAQGGHMMGPDGKEVDMEAALKSGKVGGLQNIRGVKKLTHLQKIAVEQSRLGIPLLFAADIIHGTETIFPIPLAEACSWNLEAVKETAAIAAKEGAAMGVRLTYAPMADISRDPRWGRVMESNGEDPWYNGRITEARVKGFQSDDLSNPHSMAACIKHFAAYGAVEGGRDYNTVDMSEQRLREIYLPGYKAGIDAGAATVMVAFNDLNGIPCSCNSFLLNQILRDEWGFEGFVIGDHTSVGEMVNHGVAENIKHAGELAIKGGLDMDMVSQSLLIHGEELLNQGKINIKMIDRAVRRILRIKHALGLMKDPFLYLDKQREAQWVFRPEYRDTARKIARESIVLLKNQNQLHPLNESIKTLAVIGPFADDNLTPRGEWAFGGSHYDQVVSLLEGLENRIKGTEIRLINARGCNPMDEDTGQLSEAIEAARKADMILLALGEPLEMIGEARSRISLEIPGGQQHMVSELLKLGKPMAALIQSGRPLNLTWLDNHIPTILQCWHLGHQAGHAMADVIFGDYNPSGKLPISFPRSVGQIPVYYSDKSSGRPYKPNLRWCTHYLDSPNSPLYPFGYGLSYTTFQYSEITLSSTTLSRDMTLQASITLRNKGIYRGTEVVQCYLGDVIRSSAPPVKELKDFQRIILDPGESKEIIFNITEKSLRFLAIDLQYRSEPGRFIIHIGGNSQQTVLQSFVFKG
jgi:beta-glucosidase